MTKEADRLLEALPERVRRAFVPLLAALPIETAMPQLRPSSPADERILRIAEEVLSDPVMHAPELQAAIWLYVDDLRRSHRISQAIATPTGSYWHAIMHRREGDFDNSKYWLRAAGHHPAMELIEGYEPFSFVDRVSQAGGQDDASLVQMQRREWAALFSWCAANLDEGV